MQKKFNMENETSKHSNGASYVPLGAALILQSDDFD